MIRLLTLREAAEALACSERTLRRRIAAREIAVVRDGGLLRVSTSALDAYCKRHTIPAAGDAKAAPAPPAPRMPEPAPKSHPNGRIRRLYDDPPPVALARSSKGA